MNGLFGWGNEQEKSVLEFMYELETTKSSPTSGLLLFTLQRAMMENVLPALFPDQCQGYHGLDRRSLRSVRNLLVVGVSAYPNHEITDLPCETPLRSSANHCVVVRAGMTVYTDNGEGRSATNDMRQVLKDTIDFGLFNYARMGIVRVSVFEE